MARGFDSKSVADQQEERERQRERDGRAALRPGVSPRRRTLELAKLDLLRRMEHAPEAHRAAMQAALRDLEELIGKA
jgi:hypothetical protein